jgi:hypothetical protein
MGRKKNGHRLVEQRVPGADERRTATPHKYLLDAKPAGQNVALSKHASFLRFACAARRGDTSTGLQPERGASSTANA